MHALNRDDDLEAGTRVKCPLAGCVGGEGGPPGSHLPCDSDLGTDPLAVLTLHASPSPLRLTRAARRAWREAHVCPSVHVSEGRGEPRSVCSGPHGRLDNSTALAFFGSCGAKRRLESPGEDARFLVSHQRVI